jgi:hypothetical protein
MKKILFKIIHIRNIANFMFVFSVLAISLIMLLYAFDLHSKSALKRVYYPMNVSIYLDVEGK